MNLLLNPALTLSYNQLSAFSGLDSSWNLFDTAFGTQYDRTVAVTLRSQWQAGDFSQLPQIEILDSSSTVTITSAILQATDADSFPDQLVYTLTGIPTGGSLKLNGTSLTVGSTFTQLDVLQGLVTYTNTNNLATNDSFTFNFTDNTFVTKVSVGINGSQTNGDSILPGISANGRYVTFQSNATNLVSSDTNNVSDVFIYDRQLGITKRVSVATNGTQANNVSTIETSSISSDGRFVLFQSLASNLVSGDTNNVQDGFIRDTQVGTTSLVTVANDGSQSNGLSSIGYLSDNGRYVSFVSDATNLVSGDTNNVRDVFVRDRQVGTTIRVSVASDGTQANGVSNGAYMSPDGRYVVFRSDATNLVAGDTNGFADIFLRDLLTDTTTRISNGIGGTQANGSSNLASISADGRYVVFSSDASNLVTGDTNGVRDVFLYDRQLGQIIFSSIQGNGVTDNPRISADGQLVTVTSSASNVFSVDTNGTSDVFIYDAATKTIGLVSFNNSEEVGNGASANLR
ncbi:cadherin-like domain-containing protein [Anabaena sp. UHCC 0451]|uniref:cadherin-like domain-containing protein n=1 Tax=Anabaena sp. UHCC 0451 TaxID=2055235 RepID=UPI002B2025C1|nr:cadherin-like domain-containing protein [Anabaena sp. UHCC 0451]MEA5579089.1 cadherin-like domain-containing protein [Anabaena sp. UHCC 0451]